MTFRRGSTKRFCRNILGIAILVEQLTETQFALLRSNPDILMMKALVWHGKHDVRVDTVPEPKVQFSQVLIFL